MAIHTLQVFGLVWFPTQSMPFDNYNNDCTHKVQYFHIRHTLGLDHEIPNLRARFEFWEKIYWTTGPVYPEKLLDQSNN